MKKICLIGLISLLTLIVVHQSYANTGYTYYPRWFKELHLKINNTFHIQANASYVKEQDRIDQNKHYSFCLTGNGYLEKVPDPFDQMDKLFISNGWRANERYQADGHGSSSFAYEKGNCFCLISIAIDSACDDEETGHIPSEYSFTISCRE